jgi:hypothetical protein
MTGVCALILAATMTSPTGDEGRTVHPVEQIPAPITAAISAAPALDAAPEAWMFDRKVSRPASVKVLYGTLGVLQALDVYSTQRALANGGSEINPIVNRASGNQAAMIAVKAVSTATSIYFAERAWKKNKKGAVVLMAIVNGVTAAVVARNLRNAR